MEKTSKANSNLRRGVMVFMGLAALTAIEYGIAVLEATPIFLWSIALVKAGLVLWFFMHLFRVFGVDEEEHS